AGKNVIERGDVGGSLNGCVAAQGKNASAGAPNVAQQQLQNGRRTDDLDAFRMLRPAHRITDGAGFFRTRCRRERFGGFQENILRDAAEALYHLRRVTREVTLQGLEYAARMFQTSVFFILARVPGLAAAIFPVTTAVYGMPG